MVPMCKHCSRTKVNRPRGLCWSCYYSPGVKEIYPAVSKYGRRGPGNTFAKAAFAAFPTTAAPGTPEKLAVMEQRALLNQNLWHPFDAEYEGDPRPLQASEHAVGCMSHAA